MSSEAQCKVRNGEPIGCLCVKECVCSALTFQGLRQRQQLKGRSEEWSLR